MVFLILITNKIKIKIFLQVGTFFRNVHAERRTDSLTEIPPARLVFQISLGIYTLLLLLLLLLLLFLLLSLLLLLLILLLIIIFVGDADKFEPVYRVLDTPV